MTIRIGVDIGGTFTDLVVYNTATAQISVEKVPTTPSAPEGGCVAAVHRAATQHPLTQCDYFLHGTTVGLNALLERRGAKVGLLCTAGFRDSLEIRRGSRGHSYDLQWQPPPPLVPRHLRRAVTERIDAEGHVLRQLDPKTVIEAVAHFKSCDVNAVAVCFLNSYANPAHELAARDLLRSAGFEGAISLSHQLSREYRDYERTSTAVIDAFVRNRMADYLDKVESGIRKAGFGGVSLITRSGGGSMTFAEAAERSFETINSGPVAGVEGAAELSRGLQLGDLITADVGGTSFDTSLIIDGRPQLLYQGEVSGMPIQAPWVDVRSIGAGGGSIAHVDSGGLLGVGPHSAGAEPGPACYRRGGTSATVTDAAFYLGMLGDGRLASGVTLDHELASKALTRVAAGLDGDVQKTATGIIRIACANMANAIRELTVEQGIDPRGFALLAFGGAGPLLATQIARELDVQRIIVPPFAGNFSAWGLLGSDLLRSAARTHRFALTPDGFAAASKEVTRMFAELEERDATHTAFVKEGLRELDLGMRFSGQEHSLTVRVPCDTGGIAWSLAQVESAFRDAYQRTFGISLDNTVEVIVLRAAIRKPLSRVISHARPDVHEESKGRVGQRSVYSFAREASVPAATVHRSTLQPGVRKQGPAIIYEATATTYVDCDCSFGLDANGCLILEREEVSR
jgi:N-methylhydantoinase A